MFGRKEPFLNLFSGNRILTHMAPVETQVPGLRWSFLRVSLLQDVRKAKRAEWL